MAAQSTPSTRLVVAIDGSWMRPPNAERVELTPKSLGQRLMRALAEQRLASPETPVSRDALIATLWPGEGLRRSVAENRLNVAISKLRNLGIRDALLTRGDGWLLSLDTIVAPETAN